MKSIKRDCLKNKKNIELYDTLKINFIQRNIKVFFE